MPDAARVALVTGGARRVGRAVVERLANAGFQVAFTYSRSASEAKSLQEELQSRGQKAVAIEADLLDLPAAAAKVQSELISQLGRLDVLVNNASIYEGAELASTDLALSRRLMTLHVEAPMLLCQRFAGQLRQNYGHVINMVDLLAEKPWPQYLAYCASKAALANLTLGLARELAPEATVNGIAPGVVEWPPNYPQEEKDKYLKRVPLARAGTPEDVAGVILFLCTQGRYITGQILRLDGGRSIT